MDADQAIAGEEDNQSAPRHEKFAGILRHDAFWAEVMSQPDVSDDPRPGAGFQSNFPAFFPGDDLLFHLEYREPSVDLEDLVEFSVFNLRNLSSAHQSQILQQASKKVQIAIAKAMRTGDEMSDSSTWQQVTDVFVLVREHCRSWCSLACVTRALDTSGEKLRYDVTFNAIFTRPSYRNSGNAITLMYSLGDMIGNELMEASEFFGEEISQGRMTIDAPAWPRESFSLALEFLNQCSEISGVFDPVRCDELIESTGRRHVLFEWTPKQIPHSAVQDAQLIEFSPETRAPADIPVRATTTNVLRQLVAAGVLFGEVLSDSAMDIDVVPLPHNAYLRFDYSDPQHDVWLSYIEFAKLAPLNYQWVISTESEKRAASIAKWLKMKSLDHASKPTKLLADGVLHTVM